MVPMPMLCLWAVWHVYKHLQITQKGGIYVDNIGWILNMPKPRLIPSPLAMWLNLAKSSNYYHHLVMPNGLLFRHAAYIARIY